jgi:putative FmdB family regulatory protein
MPSYDYRCRQCGSTFEVRRSITATDTTAACPDGHSDTVKLLSTVAIGGRAGSAGPASKASAPAPSGACCGGGCCG